MASKHLTNANNNNNKTMNGGQVSVAGDAAASAERTKTTINMVEAVRDTCVRRPEHKRADTSHMQAPRRAYLHGLDGLVGALHGADVFIDGLVWQQQLVEDLQRPGPVADRFQRHDRTNEGG